MRTIDEQSIKGTSFFQQLGRDARLLLRIAQMLYAYLVAGRHIRRRYRTLEARGETYWVDEELQR